MPDQTLKTDSTAPAGRVLVPQVPDHQMLRRIGGGSYGEVWLARSIMGTYRAVKIVYRDSFDNDRPFEREFTGIQKFEPISRSHESQVDILHVGKGDGYFYYVMELADDANAPCPAASAEVPDSAWVSTEYPGLSPDTYTPRTLKHDLTCRGKLPFDECLQISLSLTTALDHLHKHGLVHRDIKPSNIIFVHGIPKLADIGLVTSTDATFSCVGTEGFMAPEGPGTPQADIYSLGKVLYEISTGRDRQEFPALPTDLAELPDREHVLELNAIIAKACHHDPAGRYQSAGQMHDDCVLLQSGKSVRRVRSLERRLARATRIGAAVGAVGVVLAFAFFYQRHQTREANRLAEENHRLAVKSEQVAQFLTEMLKGLGPSAAWGADRTSLRTMLAQTAERIGQTLTNQPDVAISLRLRLGETYEELGLYEPEAENAEQTLLLARSTFGNDHLLVADSLAQLGRAWRRLHRLERSETSTRAALELRRKLLGNECLPVAESLQELAYLLLYQGKVRESETTAREALALFQKLLGGEHPEVASSLAALACVLDRTPALVEAETDAREALRLYRKLLGNEHFDTTIALNKLASIVADQGKFPEAEALMREALGTQRRLLGDKHTELVFSLCLLGDLLAEQSKIVEAEARYREALAIQRKLEGKEDPLVFPSLELAALLEKQGKPDQANALIQDEVVFRRNAVPWDADQLAGRLHHMGKLAESEAVLRQAAGGRPLDQPMDEAVQGQIVVHLADVLRERKSLAEARPVAEQALALYWQHPEWPDHERQRALWLLEKVLSDLNDSSGLEAMFRDALNRLRALSGQAASGEPSLMGLVLHHLANVLRDKKSLVEARSLGEEAVGLYRRHRDWPENERDHAYRVLEAVLKDLSDHPALEGLYRQRLDYLRSRVPSDDFQMADGLNALAYDLLQEGKFTEAEAPARECLAIFQKRAPGDFRRFCAEALLGTILAGQNKAVEGQPLLLSGCEGMKQRMAKIPASAISKEVYRQAVGRLVQLYQAAGHSEEAAQWETEINNPSPRGD